MGQNLYTSNLSEDFLLRLAYENNGVAQKKIINKSMQLSKKTLTNSDKVILIRVLKHLHETILKVRNKIKKYMMHNGYYHQSFWF